jgi:hypothetical protein
MLKTKNQNKIYNLNENNNIIFFNISIFLVLIGVIFNRPMVLGYNNASLGVLFMSVGTFGYMMSAKHISLSTKSLKIFMINNIIIIFNFITLFSSDSLVAVKVFVIAIVANICFLFCIDRILSGTAGKIFFRVIIFSGCFTAMGIWIFGIDFSLANIEILSFPIKDRGERVLETFYFPLSSFLIFGEGTFWGTIYARQMFLAIEPGVAVAVVVIWRCLEQEASRGRAFVYDGLFLIALAATGSTAAPIVAMIYYTWRILINRKNINILWFYGYLIILFIAILTFLYAPGFGYFPKSLTHGESFDLRAENLDLAVDPGNYVINSIAAIFHYFFLRPFRNKNFNLLFPVAILVTALNVIFAMPLYFLMIWLSVDLGVKKSTARTLSFVSTPRSIS